MDEIKTYVSNLRKNSLKSGRGGRVDLLFEDLQDLAHDGYRPFSQRKIQRLVERCCKGANLSVRNPHDLRHSYATVLLMSAPGITYISPIKKGFQ